MEWKVQHQADKNDNSYILKGEHIIARVYNPVTNADLIVKAVNEHQKNLDRIAELEKALKAVETLFSEGITGEEVSGMLTTINQALKGE